MEPPIEERHATWLELFFDLVIVVAVARLAHLLHDGPGVFETFLFVVLYYAMRSVWTAFHPVRQRSRDPVRVLAAEQRDADSNRHRRERLLGRFNLGGRSAGPGQPADQARVLRAALLDRPHLGERLGPFVIIVLGEAVAQLINAAADVTGWDRRLALTSAAGFGLLVAIWWLTLRYGAGPHRRGRSRCGLSFRRTTC
jgi:low temperature requirement protein LtrA